MNEAGLEVGDIVRGGGAEGYAVDQEAFSEGGGGR